MTAYLFSWDPMKWDWRNIKEQSEQLARGAPVVRQWSCGSNRRIFNGDIVYFIRQGREPRGLFARGEVVRGSYEAANVDVQDANRTRNTLVVDIRFTELENAVTQVVIPRQALGSGPFSKFVWDVKESGIKLPEDVAAALELAWKKALGKPGAADKASPKADEVAKAGAEPKPAAADSPARRKPEPPATKSPAMPAEDSEQERLKREREARLQKIKQRELEERRKRAAAAPAPVAVQALSPERRNEVLVQNYFIMLDAELQGELYSKADHRNRILKELGETDAEKVDRAHRHVSAILAETGLPFADGFPPETGFDNELEKAVHVFIEANPELVEALWIDEVPPPSSIPVELDDSRSHWVVAPEASGFRPTSRTAWHPATVNEIDYRVRESRNRNLAMAGERFVLAFERARMREAGRKEQIDQIAWQSQTFGDSFGYDILSLDDDGNERHICVKTTNYGSRFPFVLSYRELERARANPAHFYIYRVFNFSRGARLFILTGDKLSKDMLEPVVFRGWI